MKSEQVGAGAPRKQVREEMTSADSAPPGSTLAELEGKLKTVRGEIRSMQEQANEARSAAEGARKGIDQLRADVAAASLELSRMAGMAERERDDPEVAALRKRARELKAELDRVLTELGNRVRTTGTYRHRQREAELLRLKLRNTMEDRRARTEEKSKWMRRTQELEKEEEKLLEAIVAEGKAKAASGEEDSGERPPTPER